MFSSTSSIYNWPLFQWFQTWGTCTICCILQSKVYNDKIQFPVAVWIGKWVNTYISCFVHSVLSYSTYNIPSLTEYIPVFPAKGLDDGGDCRAGHIRLHSTTCLHHCEAMVDNMVYKCEPNFIRDNMGSSCSSVSSPYSTTTHPYSSSSSSSRLFIYLARCLHVQKLYWSWF